MALKTYGPMAVDWEKRIDFDRLRRERLARAKALLGEVGDGRVAVLRHEQRALHHRNAHRHMGAGQNQPLYSCCRKMTSRSCGILARLPDITSKIAPGWANVRARAFLCCAARCLRKWGARKMSRARSRSNWRSAGCMKEPLGIDVVEPPILFALQKEGIKVVDGQQLMSDARVIKTQDEISLLNHSAMMVDAAYDELYRAMKPGMSENQAVGLASKVLYDLGSEYVEAVNAISGERCNPHPHVFSRSRSAPRRSRLLRHSAFLHGLPHLLLPLLLDRLRIARHDRRLQALPRISGRRNFAGAARTHHRGNRVGVAEGAGVRLPR